MASGLTGVFPPTLQRYLPPDLGGVANLVKDSFTLPTLLVIGASIQATLTLILSPRYAMLPAVFLLLRAVARTALQLNSTSKLDMIHGKVAAQIPLSSYHPSDTTPFGTKPSSQGLVVFHLGAKFNHPLGPLTPNAKNLGEHFKACITELTDKAKEYGCIDVSQYKGVENEKNNVLLSVFYFQDIEGLNRFAMDSVHRKAWDWWARYRKSERGRRGELGIYHEAFEVKPGGWETIYENMPPTLLGRASVSVKNEETGEDEWVRTLVRADGKGMEGQFVRMNRKTLNGRK